MFFKQHSLSSSYIQVLNATTNQWFGQIIAKGDSKYSNNENDIIVGHDKQHQCIPKRNLHYVNQSGQNVFSQPATQNNKCYYYSYIYTTSLEKLQISRADTLYAAEL